ncbi:LPO_1073/Vpar_1526 family protein [Amycolatopsis sp. NPDC024027]|uniref:LPO_1073/Vpar_1526 family protein n=1 Tax=Amycolatopsis sp. NPDC024027 TaxID=3154327 RepID=UPI0033F09839
MKNRIDSGDDSQNFLAGRDIHVGVTPTDAIAISKEVVEQALGVYSHEVREEVEARFRDFREEVVQRICQSSPASLVAFRDVDIQAAFFEASTAYVRTGRDDVKRSLVDLVAARCNAKSGGLQAVVLNEAISTVRKLTREGIAALTVAFVAQRVQFADVVDLADLNARCKRALFPLFDTDLPRWQPGAQAELNHLMAVGCATLLAEEQTLQCILVKSYPGLFQEGHFRRAISSDLLTVSDRMVRDYQSIPLFVPCAQDENKLRVNALNRANAETLIRTYARPDEERELVEEYLFLLENGVLNLDQVRDRLTELDHEWETLMFIWEDHPWLSRLEPTSVGLAIAHANWARLLGYETVPLDDWLPR